MARSYLPVSLLISLLFLYSALGNPQSIWRRKAVDKKLNNGLLLKSTGSRIMCNAACNILPDCISYNYKDDGMQCELLNTGMMNIGQLTDASGWSYMSQVPPKRPKPGDSCASPGSVAVRYDQPANLRFNDTIPGYACTQHSWVLNQHSQGLTDCHFVLDYEINFVGMDTSYNALMPHYYEAFKHCESVDCVGMVCRKGGSGVSVSCIRNCTLGSEAQYKSLPTEIIPEEWETERDGIPFKCWLKHDTHLTQNERKRSTDSNYVFWYASCKSP